MNPDSNPNESLLLEALLQEQKRGNREQSIQAIEEAIKKSAVAPATSVKRSRRGPLLVGIAATVALSAAILHERGVFRQATPIVATHEVVVPKQPRENNEIERLTQREMPVTNAPENRRPDVSQLAPLISSDAPLGGLKAIPIDDEVTFHSPGDKGGYTMPQEELAKTAAHAERNLELRVVPSQSDASARVRTIVPPSGAPPAPETESIVGGQLKGETRFNTTKDVDNRRMTGMWADPTTPGDRYGALTDPSWKNPRENALSTFSVDVDNAAYSNIRRMVEEGRSIPPDAVRIEECINAFDYGYAPPTNGDAFAVHQALRSCPWNEKNALLRIGIKGREIPNNERPASNLVFLIDVSGSMQSQDKLPLVKDSLKILIDRLDERDSVSYVVYAGSEGVVLPPTTLDAAGRDRALAALDKLTAGGSTNGGAGIQRAYQIAAEQFRKGGVNRVILCSDGDFNVGVTNTDSLVSLVKERAAANIYLSVLSFGTGNLNDEMLEKISGDGNGNYYYIDGIREARKVFLQKLSGTLVTIAKDVKLQLEFNPARVASYRLIGYANRQLRDQDFSDDKVDAGDIGAGHEVTAFYEIVPAGAAATGADTSLKYQPGVQELDAAPKPAVHADEWLTIKLRHKHPEGDISKLQEHALRGEIGALEAGDTDFRFASAVAMFGMRLRSYSHFGSSWDDVRKLATEGLGNDPKGERAAFIDLVRRMPGQ
jgi:secreted protein with Ig-like and vWFA domain